MAVLNSQYQSNCMLDLTPFAAVIYRKTLNFTRIAFVLYYMDYDDEYGSSTQLIQFLARKFLTRREIHNTYDEDIILRTPECCIINFNISASLDK